MTTTTRARIRVPAIYRIYDRDGLLLYIGKTVDPGNRIRDHRADKPWWKEVARIDIEHVRDSVDLGRIEAQAIRNERPLYNVAMQGLGGLRQSIDERRAEMRAAKKREAEEQEEQSIHDAVADKVCGGVIWGWVWYCDACTNHGTANSAAEARALATAHVVFAQTANLYTFIETPLDAEELATERNYAQDLGHDEGCDFSAIVLAYRQSPRDDIDEPAHQPPWILMRHIYATDDPNIEE